MKKSNKTETMEEGLYSAPYTKGDSDSEEGAESETAGEDTPKEEDAESGDAVYEMFCALPEKERERILTMMKNHHGAVAKKPLKADDEREFSPMKGV